MKSSTKVLFYNFGIKLNCGSVTDMDVARFDKLSDRKREIFAIIHIYQYSKLLGVGER